MKSGNVPIDALVAFGANQGDRENALENTLQRLADSAEIDEIVTAKPITTTPVTGLSQKPSQSDYFNSAIRLKTTFAPEDFFRKLVQIEQELGRERHQRWGPRTIDLDLLLFGDKVLQTEDLQVPHPRMSFRRFVLQPANEIAGDMVHPSSGMTIGQLLEHLDGERDLILVVTDQQQQASELAATPNSKFPVLVVDSPEAFISNAPRAKLVVSFFTKVSSDSLSRYAANFAGPTLQLSGDSIESALREVTAATESMLAL